MQDCVFCSVNENLRLAEPFGLDHVAAQAGARHVERVRELNRERIVARFAGTSPPDISQLGIVGAGIMGRAIAAAAVASGIDVIVTDAAESIRQRAAEAIRRLVAEYPAADTCGRVTVVDQLETLASCHLVIETIVEEESAKAALLKELDRLLPPDKFLATNTSTIPISRLSRGLEHPERFCGVHFFLPVRHRPLVEAIFAEETSSMTQAVAARFARVMDRDVLLAPDSAGFIVNRLMMPYAAEALQLLGEGVAPERIDDVAVRFGMPLGPLALLDSIGLDTVLKCGWIFISAFGERLPVSPMLVAMVKAGRLGQKTDAGFYRYANDPRGVVRPEHDPAAAELVARWVAPVGDVDDETIAARLFLPMVFEGTRLLDERENCHAADVDLGVVLGLGMAHARGGPLFWADRVGPAVVLDMAESLKSLGPRMEPPQRLQHMARSETPFHAETTT